jgi:hypothetical protein
LSPFIPAPDPDRWKKDHGRRLLRPRPGGIARYPLKRKLDYASHMRSLGDAPIALVMPGARSYCR